MQQQIRYGLVGTGMMGVEHLHNLAITPGCVVTAIADPVASSRERALAAMRKLGMPVENVAIYQTAAELAAAGVVDAVVVASPNYTHREVLEPLFNADLHLLCEKPLATRLEDAR